MKTLVMKFVEMDSIMASISVMMVIFCLEMGVAQIVESNLDMHAQGGQILLLIHVLQFVGMEM